MITLKETVEMMTNPDFKERFKAEYYQLENRLNGLKKMLKGYKEGTLDFTPNCSYELLDSQREVMENYLEILKERAIIESIEL